MLLISLLVTLLLEIDQSLINHRENLYLNWLTQTKLKAIKFIHVSSKGGLPGGAGVLSGWGCATGTLEPLTYTSAISAEFCYPVLELTPQIPLF